MDTTHHFSQEKVVKRMEEIMGQNNNPTTKKLSCSSSTTTTLERKLRPQQKDEALNCPRCNSTNTKFCYYNNYSLTQPRYFCKSCKRYWTQGGSLRNIPIGGALRKNKKHSFSSNLSSRINVFANHDHQAKDLNSGFSQNQNHDQFRSISQFIHLPNIENPSKIPNPSPNYVASQFSTIPSLEDANYQNHMVHSSGFHVPDDHFKANTLNFGYGNLQGGNEQQKETNKDSDVTVLPFAKAGLEGTTKEETNNNERIFFSFEDLKPISNNTSVDLDNNELNREQENYSTGYWTGLLDSGALW